MWNDQNMLNSHCKLNKTRTDPRSTYFSISKSLSLSESDMAWMILFAADEPGFLLEETTFFAVATWFDEI